MRLGIANRKGEILNATLQRYGESNSRLSAPLICRTFLTLTLRSPPERQGPLLLSMVARL